MNDPDTSRTERDSLRMSSLEVPGWTAPPSGHVPAAGDQVYCTEGPARVVRLLGRTSDGSRLLELSCPDRPQPFFASSSNVLIRTDPTGIPGFLDESDAVGAS